LSVGLVALVAIGTTIMVVLVGWTVWVVTSSNDPFVPPPKSPHANRELCDAVDTFLQDVSGVAPSSISAHTDLDQAMGIRGYCSFLNEYGRAYARVQMWSTPPSFVDDRVFPKPGEETVLGSSKPVSLELRSGEVVLGTVLGPWEASFAIDSEPHIDMTRERIEEAAELLIQLTEDLRE
jgi:hypothetical protein